MNINAESASERASSENESRPDLSEHQILPIGVPTGVDSDGYLLNETSIDNITKPWNEPVKELVEGYQRSLGDALHSIYIRGSLVRGTAVEGQSDLDAIALVNGAASEMDLSWRKQLHNEIMQKYPFLRGVDVGINDVERVLQGDRKVRAFLIKTASACISGEDISDQLPSVKPGRDALVVRWGFRKEIQPDFFDGKDVSLSQKSRRTGKKILRGGMELVMEDEQAFARDLYPCYEMFARHYPEKAAAMKRALTQALFSAGSEADFEEMRDDIGPWLADELEKKYPE